MEKLGMQGRVKLHELAISQINAMGFDEKVMLGSGDEENYLKFYEKIFNKLKELTEAE